MPETVDPSGLAGRGAGRRHPVHADGPRRRHRARRHRDHRVGAGPDGRRRPGQRSARGGHPAARPARRPGRQRPAGTPAQPAHRRPAAAPGPGLAVHRHRDCRAPPRCWSWPPSSNCARRPGHPRPSGSCCCATGPRCRCAGPNRRTRRWWPRCTRAAPRRPAAPGSSARPRGCRRPSSPSCSVAKTRYRDGGARGDRRRRQRGRGGHDGHRSGGRRPVRGAGRGRLAGPGAGHRTAPPGRRRGRRAGALELVGTARPNELGLARLLRRPGCARRRSWSARSSASRCPPRSARPGWAPQMRVGQISMRSPESPANMCTWPARGARYSTSPLAGGRRPSTRTITDLRSPSNSVLP